MSTESSSPLNYRWLKATHKDLLFWGIDGPLPWPSEEKAPSEARENFPFRLLLEGIGRLRAAGRETPEKCERWEKVERFIETGEELGDAIEAGDFATTLKVLGEMEALRPGTPYCEFNRGFVLESQGDLEGALAALTEATQRCAKLEFLWLRRGAVHEELEQDKDAIFCYRKALALLPNHAEALEGLARLGALMKVTERLPDGSHRVRYLKHEDWMRELELNVKSMRPDAPRLRSFLRQFQKPGDGAQALLVVDRILSGDPPDRLELLVQRADALRRVGRFEEALEVLEEVREEQPRHAEARYVEAWVEFDTKRIDSGWELINEVLEIDPNHQKALQTRFGVGVKPDPVKHNQMLDWGREHHSWRCFWLASINACTVENDRGALRHAETAYKMAPEERDALFLYANCLNNADEGEHLAALVHPRLPEAKGDYQLKYVFAGAMKKLGLPEVAIRVLRESLQEESEMDLQWRQNTQHFLDSLQGLLAEGDVEVELHSGVTVLRRSIWVGNDEGPKVELIPAGVGLPATRRVKMERPPGFTGATGSVAFYLHAHQTELEPVSLGWFRAHEIDFESAEKPLMQATATAKGKLEATVMQGTRRLPVTWSLYRVPSMETEGEKGNAGT